MASSVKIIESRTDFISGEICKLLILLTKWSENNIKSVINTDFIRKINSFY